MRNKHKTSLAKELKGRLLAYSVAAGAGVLASADAARAGIVWRPISNFVNYDTSAPSISTAMARPTSDSGSTSGPLVPTIRHSNQTLGSNP